VTADVDPASAGSGDQGGADDPIVWCDRCGGSLAEREHTECAEFRALEPPRYCSRCRRRMVVQVLPAGWSARCSVHGPTS